MPSCVVYIFVTMWFIVFSTATGDAELRCSPGYFLDRESHRCEPCPSGTYTPVPMPSHACLKHTDCSALYNRGVLTEGTSMTDNECGRCLVQYVDEEGSHLTDPSSFLTTCVPCGDTQPEVSVQNSRQCPPSYHTSHKEDELSAVNLRAIIIAASLVTVFGVASVSAVLARKRLYRLTKKPSEMPTPEKGEVLKQPKMDLFKPSCMVLTTEQGDVLAQVEMDPFQRTFTQKDCAFGSY